MKTSETLRIARTLELVQREKRADELKLLDKQSKQLKFLQSKIVQVRRDIIGKRSLLTISIERLRTHVHLEKSHLAHLSAITHTIKKLDSSMKRMASTRKYLLEREHALLTDIETFVEKNHDALSYGTLSPILKKKRKILTDTTSMLAKEQSILFADEQAARVIVENQRSIVEKMEHALRERSASLQNLTAEHDMLLKKESQFNRKLHSLDARRRRLQKQLESP